MIDWLHPSLILLAGAALVPLLRGRLRQAWLVALPAIVLAVLVTLEPGTYGQFSFLNFDLVTGRVDSLSLVFAYVFGIILLVGMIYALHVDDLVQQLAALVYAASALGVLLAGDLVTLYVFWELMAIASVWLIWRRRTPESYAAGFRYLIIHAVGGVLLLAGIVMYYLHTGSILFDEIEVGGAAFYLILVAFMINAAVPPLHAWLTDAYPEATITGAIFLSALTTKTAVYTLIRGYPGTELLLWMGTAMAAYGVIYAMLANDIRRLLAYHIVSQVGYMVAGVGMGTALALNGAASHAFAHILYKALLFMGAGAVIHMTGRSKLTELGGLYRYMPLTFVFYVIGGFSISAMPLFSGFVSKTIILEAAAVNGLGAVYLILMAVSVGTFMSTTLKIPYFAFIKEPAQAGEPALQPREAPVNMLVAMGIAAFLCVFFGLFPGALYALLPTEVTYNAYTLGHVLKELQLLLFTGLGFFLLLKHVGGKPVISLDVDWFYRRPGVAGAAALRRLVVGTDRICRRGFLTLLDRGLERFYGVTGNPGLNNAWPTGSMAFWIAVVLVVLLGFGILR